MATDLHQNQLALVVPIVIGVRWCLQWDSIMCLETY